MGFGGGGGWQPRIVPARYIAGEPIPDEAHTMSGPWILERKAQNGFERVGLFGSIAEATKAIDEQVGMGHGQPSDYEIEHAPKRSWWVKVGKHLSRGRSNSASH